MSQVIQNNNLWSKLRYGVESYRQFGGATEANFQLGESELDPARWVDDNCPFDREKYHKNRA